MHSNCSTRDVNHALADYSVSAFLFLAKGISECKNCKQGNRMLSLDVNKKEVGTKKYAEPSKAPT